MNKTVTAVVASSRELCGDFDWTAKLFFAIRNVQSVQALMICAAGILAHRYKINRSVRTSGQVDNRCGGDADLWFDLRTTEYGLCGRLTCGKHGHSPERITRLIGIV